MLSQKPDFIVGTTGRIIDLIERGSIDISNIQTLILDEADWMLDMGFKPDIDKILEFLKNESKNF